MVSANVNESGWEGVGFVRPCDIKYTTGVVSVSERFGGTPYADAE